MANGELLSRDEIDALLHVVDSGALGNGNDGINDGVARPFHFSGQDRITRGRLPSLGRINERFACLFQASIFKMLRRKAEISVGDVQVVKFSEYTHSLFAPSSLNLIHIPPLRGKALCMFDPDLVFLTTDCYFGGSGRYSRIEHREFSPMENRVTQSLVEYALQDLKQAWAPILAAEPEFISTDTSPHLITIAGPSEFVVVSNFHLELAGSSGTFQIVMPYSMLEPVCELLDTGGVRGDQPAGDERWREALYQDVKAAAVTLSCTLAKTSLRLGDLLNLKPGDVIPINCPDNVTVLAEEVPVFYGVYGMHNGNKAVKVKKMIKRSTPDSELFPQMVSGENK